MKENSKQKVLPAIAAGVFCGALIFSAVRFAFSGPLYRSVMYFPSFDTASLCTEVRKLPSVHGKERVSVFVDELLLGPMTYRYKNLFPQGTRAEFCFVKDKVLYVGLNETALSLHGEVVPPKEGVELLKKNILRN